MSDNVIDDLADLGILLEPNAADVILSDPDPITFALYIDDFLTSEGRGSLVIALEDVQDYLEHKQRQAEKERRLLRL